MVRLQAHRGVSSEYPENTLAAFLASVEQGYDLIECDPKYTKDGKIVILHDATLNRTARLQNGETLREELPIQQITLSQARELEYGSWFAPGFKGEQIPTLADLLDLAEQTQISIKLDNVWERFPKEIQNLFFEEIAARSDRLRVGITCSQPEHLCTAAKVLPHAELHYDGQDLSPKTLTEVVTIAAGHPLTVWVCFDNALTQWFRGPKATPELCTTVRNYGEIGIWLLSKQEELISAIRDFHAQVIETTGHIKPQWLKTLAKQK